MKYLEPKAPTSTKFYMLDYSKQFAGDSIKSVAITVNSGDVTLSKIVWRDNKIGTMISGGTADITAELIVSIQTNAGQALVDTATLFIITDENEVDFSVITKEQIIEWAFQDIRLSGYTFDHTPNELSAMLSRLDGLMREYRLRQIDIGYNHPKNIGQSNLNDISGIEDGLGLSVATLLAQSFMDGMGKSYTPSFIKKANSAWNFIYAYANVPINRVFNPFTPRGAGQKMWSTYSPFFTGQTVSDRAGLINQLSGQYIVAAVWDQSFWDQGVWG